MLSDLGGCRPRRRDADTTWRVSQDSCLANPRPRLQEITDERVLVVKRYRDADRTVRNAVKTAGRIAKAVQRIAPLEAEQKTACEHGVTKGRRCRREPTVMAEKACCSR